MKKLDYWETPTGKTIKTEIVDLPGKGRMRIGAIYIPDKEEEPEWLPAVFGVLLADEKTLREAYGCKVKDIKRYKREGIANRTPYGKIAFSVPVIWKINKETGDFESWIVSGRKEVLNLIKKFNMPF